MPSAAIFAAALIESGRHDHVSVTTYSLRCESSYLRSPGLSRFNSIAETIVPLRRSRLMIQQPVEGEGEETPHGRGCDRLSSLITAG